MGLLIAAATLIAGFGTAYLASSEVRYLTRAGIEETRILTHRVPIQALASDPSVPDSVRQLAGLVIEARTYAAGLGLDAKQTYTTYSNVGRDTLLLVLTASPRNCICPVTWKYPVAGRVPYKGFFDFAQAHRMADDFTKRGFDVNLRPSAAFSTLGWFNDPLLSTALTRDSVELASLVFHEIAHNSLWVKGATDFNESFAQWVGYRATEQFFLTLGDSAKALRAAQRWHDEQVLADYYTILMGKLDSLYGLHLPPAQNDSGRAALARWRRDTLQNGFGPKLEAMQLGRVTEQPINNAGLIGVRLYRTNLDLFDAWDNANDRKLTFAVAKLKEILQDSPPEQAFDRMRAVLKIGRKPQ